MLDRAQIYRSVFDATPPLPKSDPSFFLAPEVLDQPSADLQGMSSWDIATRYHEFKSIRSLREKWKYLRRISALAILDKAQEILGSVVHPMEQRLGILSDLPVYAENTDLDLDETLDHSPLAVVDILDQDGGSSLLDYSVTAQDIWMSYTVRRRQSLVFSVDTSLSMTGEKLALTAVALAVVLLEFPDDPIGIVAFENEAKVLKNPDEKISLQMLIERFLDVPAQGYTHLEEGIKAALRLVQIAQIGGQGKPASVVLLTDGKYTAGRDPAYLACRFGHLVVLKMGAERASLELCRELARKGHGVLHEVDELESLPRVMYGVVKDLLRGHSIS